MNALHHMLKSVIAELSFLLEYHLHIYPAWVTLTIIAAASGFFLGVVYYILRNMLHLQGWILKGWKYLSTAYIMISSFFIDIIVKNLPTCVSRLHRILENFAYVTSFDGARNTFFRGIGIPDNMVNRSALQRIAFFLNEEQWQNVIRANDSSAWYFDKIRKGIEGVIKTGDSHLSIGVINQAIDAYIPILLLLFIAYLLFLKRRRICLAVYSSAVLCCIGNLGAAIYMLVLWSAFLVFLLWSERRRT